MIDLAKLKRLEAEATKGPWKGNAELINVVYVDIGDEWQGASVITSDDGGVIAKQADLDLIAESRNAMPEMLRFVERSKHYLETLLELAKEDLVELEIGEREELPVLLAALKEPENGK